ncbi:MAG: hypothetical protein A2017_08295 [Lentisphaerae bacterium GWF2_44_16]|nr:MAG: hypothetical protein A2017_08295 [Lentisphaerae bacterium GWF2_44_16]
MQKLTTKLIVVRPLETNKVLINPGMGFTTFNRFNGDINPCELVIKSPDPESNGVIAENKDYPLSSLAYFRTYWRFIEPSPKKYNWELIDYLLETAKFRKQSLVLRIPGRNKRVYEYPDWYLEKVGGWEKLTKKYPIPTEDPCYVKYYGNMIRALGERYDGHPYLDSVDLSISGSCGEGGGAADLSGKARETLLDSYLNSFVKTPLLMLCSDEKTTSYSMSKNAAGWRADCLGDMGGWDDDYSHMLDYYPRAIIKYGLQNAWKKAPVHFEAAWNMKHWLEKKWDIDYIIEQSLKWHISAFNNKSSPIPGKYWTKVNKWLKKMGYRFVLRKLSYPGNVISGKKFLIETWWENKGVAPIYRNYVLAFRLKNQNSSYIIKTDADIRNWLPGDIIYDTELFISDSIPKEKYNIQIGIIDKDTERPMVKLAITGKINSGWYEMGEVTVN